MTNFDFDYLFRISIIGDSGIGYVFVAFFPIYNDTIMYTI